jgi:hypothetical protein
MVQTVHCPGCHQVVDVARPPDVNFVIDRAEVQDGGGVVTILIGRVVVHRCLECRDGEWR